MPDLQPELSSSATTLSSVINPVQFHYSITPKLDDSNFLLWKSQVLPVIRGHGLLSFLDGTVTASTGDEHSNHQDQLILAWLLSSLGPEVLPQAISCDTSADLWRMLHSTHSARSNSRILELKLKLQLQTLKKGDQTCTEFLNRLKSIALQLRSIGCDISDDDLSLCLFAGLPSEYNALVTSLTSQSTSFSLTDLHGHLLNFESRLSSQEATDHAAHLTLGGSGFASATPGLDLISKGPAASTKAGFNSQIQPNLLLQGLAPGLAGANSAPSLGCVLAPALVSTLPLQSQQQLAAAYLSQQFNCSQSRGGRGRNRGRGRGRGRNYQQQQPDSSADSQGRGNAGRGNLPQVPCQICTKVGHTAKECWYRYDDDPSTPPQVNIAQPTSLPTTDWFLDSGASSHITPDLNCLTNYTPYQGTDIV